VFILAFSISAGIGSAPQEEAITLPVVNLDAGSGASQTLLEALDRGGGVQCALYEEAQAKASLDKGSINRVLTIPTNYAADLQAGNPVTLLMVNGPDSNPARSEAVQRVVTGVAADLSMETQLIASLRQMADMQAAASPEDQVFTSEIIVQQAQSQFTRARTEPLRRRELAGNPARRRAAGVQPPHCICTRFRRALSLSDGADYGAVDIRGKKDWQFSSPAGCSY
jgi:hypothetical protein